MESKSGSDPANRRQAWLLSDNVVSFDCKIPQHGWCERFAAAEQPAVLIGGARGIAVNLDNILRQVDQPGFGNTSLSIQEHLDITVVVQGRIGYLNNEHDIIGDRVGPRIEIVPRFEKGYIGKGFGVFIDMNRVRMLTIIRFRSKLLRISPAFLTQAASGCRSGTFR